jgi:hypothetical protein
MGSVFMGEPSRRSGESPYILGLGSTSQANFRRTAVARTLTNPKIQASGSYLKLQVPRFNKTAFENAYIEVSFDST